MSEFDTVDYKRKFQKQQVIQVYTANIVIGCDVQDE